MTENNQVPEIEIEPAGNGLYRVTRDGKPQTGPLSKRDAVKVANVLDAKPAGPSLPQAFFIRWIFITVVMVAVGVMMDLGWVAIAIGWIIVSTSLASFMSLFRG